MYDRRVKGRTLTLAVSGILWKNSLVLIDKETRSLWAHLLGRALRGPMKGAKLKQIPSVITDWKSWKERYPQTTFAKMSRVGNEYRRRLVPKITHLLLIGLVVGDRVRAWKISDLVQHPVVNDRLGDSSVLVIYDETSATVVLHGRRLDSQDLFFAMENKKLIDRKTNSEWDLLTGTAIAGPLKGRKLPTLPGIISFREAWNSYHPDSTYWKPSESTGKSGK